MGKENGQHSEEVSRCCFLLSSEINDQYKKTLVRIMSLFHSSIHAIILIPLQSYPEAGGKVQRHFQDCSWYHSECVSAARHGEKESHPAHQGPLQDWPKCQPPLAGAGSATHTWPVGMDISLSHKGLKQHWNKIQSLDWYYNDGCYINDDYFSPPYFLNINNNISYMQYNNLTHAGSFVAHE